MVKNEEFYSRAQKTRDYYKERGLYAYSNIVKIIAGEVFENEDEFPNVLLFCGQHYSKDMVEDVLRNLELTYEELTCANPYFIIKNLKLK